MIINRVYELGGQTSPLCWTKITKWQKYSQNKYYICTTVFNFI